MEMVLEYLTNILYKNSNHSFNPSSNGNGAGILLAKSLKAAVFSFNPSSNGNGAGIKDIFKALSLIWEFQSFF